jgi:hypothetical protein
VEWCLGFEVPRVACRLLRRSHAGRRHASVSEALLEDPGVAIVIRVRAEDGADSSTYTEEWCGCVHLPRIEGRHQTVPNAPDRCT